MAVVHAICSFQLGSESTRELVLKPIRQESATGFSLRFAAKFCGAGELEVVRLDFDRDEVLQLEKAIRRYKKEMKERG